MPNVEKNLLRFFTIALLCIMGAFIFIFGSIPESRRWNDLRKNGVPTEAVILSIDKVSIQHGRSLSYVHLGYVEFTFNDKHYEGRLNTHSRDWKVGDTVTVYVSPDDPKNFMAEPQNSSSNYFIGFIMLIVGAAAVYIGLRKIEKDDGLKPSEIIPYIINKEKFE